MASSYPASTVLIEWVSEDRITLPPASFIFKRSSFEGLEQIITAIDKAKQRLDANVNFDIAMELLMLTIKEN